MKSTRFPRLLALLLLVQTGAAPLHAAPQKSRRESTKIARYVRIELPGNNRILSLAEVQVIRNGRNFAPTGTASQSGTDFGGLPGRAIDGNTSGVFSAGSVTHTPSSKDPWWELDLGKAQGVQQVSIWNRTEAHENRLDNFTLRLLDARREVVWERRSLRAPRPRTDYLMTGESVVRGAPIEDVAVSVERRQRLQPAVNAAITRGVRYLKDTQLRDGSWGEHQPQYRAGQTALAVYTLVKSGVSRTDPAVRMGLRFLQENPPVKTYSIGVTMMLYETLAEEERREPLEDLLDRLIDTQIKNKGTERGLWGYPHGCDLSNTQYAALGLRAARRAGLTVPREAYLELIEGTMRYQEAPQIVVVETPTGRTSTGKVRMAGFWYSKGGRRATLSMTTAGVSILAICQQGLMAGGGVKNLSDARTSQQLGLEYLHRNFSVTAGGQWKHYYLYGLERVGALLGLDYIGGRNWYWEGAEELVRTQGEQGHWNNKQSDTCFALLFLSKATAGGASTGLLANAREDVRVSDGPAVDIRWVAAGSDPVRMWITGFSEDLIEEYSDEDGLVQGLRISRVDYLCEGEVIQSIPVDPDRGWAGGRFATEYEFPGPGRYQMEVIVRVVGFAAGDGEFGEAEIASLPLDVFVRDEFSEAALEAPAGSRRTNLLAGKEVTAQASSQKENRNDVRQAIDGAQGTKWLSAKDDAQPTLTFRFDKPVRANTLVLSDANSSILTRRTYDRPTRIEVSVNGARKPKIVEISEGVYSYWTLRFRSMRVRSLEIRILEREPGTQQAGIVGFGEVELTYDR